MFPLGLLVIRPHQPSPALAPQDAGMGTRSVPLLMSSSFLTRPAAWMERPPGLPGLRQHWYLWNWKKGPWSEACTGEEEQVLHGRLAERSPFALPSSAHVPASSSQTYGLCLIQHLWALVRPGGEAVLGKRNREAPRQRGHSHPHKSKYSESMGGLAGKMLCSVFSVGSIYLYC